MSVADLSPIVPLPDAVDILRRWLVAQAEFTSRAAQRAWSEVPRTKPAGDERFVLLRRTGGTPPLARPLRFDTPRIDVHAYGGTKAQALELAEVIRSLISARFIGLVEFGALRVVVDGVRWLLSPQDLPDDDLAGEGGGARPRYVTSLVVDLHLPHDATP